MIGIIFQNNNEWFVRHEFGQGQVKNYPLHPSCIQGADEFGIEGEEVIFEVKGMSAPRTLNGAVPSAVIIYKEIENG